MPKNILELCLSPDLGGLELYMVRASHYLHNKTKVVSVINEAGKLGQYYEGEPYAYETLRRRNVFLSFATAKKLADIIDTNDIDVVHLHWTRDIPTAVLAKLISKKKPKLVQTRNMTMTRFKDDVYHRWLYRHLDMMLPVTHQVKAQLERFIPADIRPRVEVLYMGAETPAMIDAEARRQLRTQYGLDDAFTVGIVGRIEKGKGQYLVIEAVEKLNREGLDVRALIVGHAMREEYLAQLKSGVHEKGFDEKVVFTGFTREAQTLMQVCDCLVLATDRETFGLVLIEAMAGGVAVIGTDNGGPLEIIDDGETGLLFKNRDSDDLAMQIRTLTDEAYRDRLAEAGRAKAAERFDSVKQFEKLSDILERL